MPFFKQEPTKIAEWFALVNEAQEQSGYCFDENIENYLVITLDHFMTEASLVTSVIALDFLNGVDLSGRQGGDLLRHVGDQCLLLSGLFPERALKRNVSLNYFIGMGQQAYHIISSSSSFDTDLFHKLSENFVGLMDVLHTMREMPCRYCGRHFQ